LDEIFFRVFGLIGQQLSFFVPKSDFKFNFNQFERKTHQNLWKNIKVGSHWWEISDHVVSQKLTLRGTKLTFFIMILIFDSFINLQSGEYGYLSKFYPPPPPTPSSEMTILFHFASYER
jgi:hypothetical protein